MENENKLKIVHYFKQVPIMKKIRAKKNVGYGQQFK